MIWSFFSKKKYKGRKKIKPKGRNRTLKSKVELAYPKNVYLEQKKPGKNRALKQQ